MFEKIWFILLAFLLTGYTVLDGLDLGAGILFPFVAKNEKERSLTLQAIGPIWDGNEVWLVAAGGVLFFAFPKAYASAMSGLYLAVILILWLIVLRALAIELRGQIDNLLWEEFWEAVFFLSSLGLALILGAALGNLLRGFPLDAKGNFFLPLWTNFLPSTATGVLDWYSAATGIFAAAILTLHGANFLAWKTAGGVQERARAAASGLLWGSGAFTLLIFILTPIIQPLAGPRFLSHPWGFIFPLLAVAAWLLLFNTIRRGHSEILSLGYSAMLIASLLATAFFSMFPNLLIAPASAAQSLTIFNASASPYGLQAGLAWFSLGLVLLLSYTGYVYKVFWGKATLAGEEDY